MTTNDPDQKMVELYITGMVEKVVTITPKSVKLIGKAGKKLTSELTIIPEKKHAFTIKKITARKGEHFSFSYKEKIMENGVKGYVLTVSNKKKDKGRFTDSLTIETDSKYRPSIHLHLLGNLF